MSRNRIFITGLAASTLLIAGCGSDDGGGSSAAVPANAVLINSSTIAEETIISAAVTGYIFKSIVGIEASPVITAQDVVDIVMSKVLEKAQSSHSAVTGVQFNDPCAVSGFVSGNETTTSSTYNATANFNACNDGTATISGSAAINATFTNPAGPYTATITGNFTATVNNFTLSLNGLNITQSGNDSSGIYTISTFTFAANPSTGGGYAIQLSQPLTGNEFDSCELNGGRAIISGVSNSQARATINANGSAKLEYHSGDGNFIETDNSPISCLF